MKQCQRIHYNMNNDTFYRIANDTGIKKKSYVNGEDIPFFKPGITGMNYQQRKSFQQKGKLPSWKRNSKSRSPKKQMNISAYHTLDAKPNPKNKTYIFDTILSKNKAKKDFQKYRSPQLTFYNLQKSPRSQNSEENITNKFLVTSRKFQELNQEKVTENHSPKKQIPGNVSKKKMTDEMCVTLTKLPAIEQDKYYKEKKIKEKRKRSLKEQKLPKQCQQRQQYKNQRSIFYRFRPDLIFQQNQRSLEKQKERRKNLIQLQKLAISMMNKQTKEKIN